MIPNPNSPLQQLDLSQAPSSDGQPMQIPRIDHIIAHAKHPEFSYIYARPELQASASSALPQAGTPTQGDASTPKKGRPREKKQGEAGDKKPGTKMRKNEIYDKYYLDNTRPKKVVPAKKVDLWDKEAWEDILNRKRKYFDFIKLTGDLTNWKSDDDEDDSREEEGDIENIEGTRDDFKEDQRESAEAEESKEESEDKIEEKMQMETDINAGNLQQAEYIESTENIEDKDKNIASMQEIGISAEPQGIEAVGSVGEFRETENNGAREVMQVESENKSEDLGNNQLTIDMQDMIDYSQPHRPSSPS